MKKMLNCEYVYNIMRLILFVVGKILDSSELLSCLLFRNGCRILPGTRYVSEKECRVGKAWSHREAAGG